MAKVKFNLAASVVLRFVRSFLAQMVVYVPVAITFLAEHPEVASLVSQYVYWAIPVLGFASSLILSVDKLRRELGK